MKNDRNMGMMPFPNMMGGMPTNMLMFPNYMNDNYNNLDTRISSLEKKVKVLENRISRLEVPYQNNLNTNINHKLHINQPKIPDITEICI